ncbi:hypothetical protein GCM10011588_42980 [Nocardia jinanensis]|uniref:Uncharacterized protein n=1 Tax=Nocardia jinanensis TaxID=382504 RepID=A0A917RSR7_9NOCA|nr:hypothetical protein GCM10011588_42980 [Nocardia jinanensis]
MKAAPPEAVRFGNKGAGADVMRLSRVVTGVCATPDAGERVAAGGHHCVRARCDAWVLG